MKKIETVYREILYRTMEKNEFNLTQSELSKKLNISLSIINLAVKKLNFVGALKIKQRSFHVLDIKKIHTHRGNGRSVRWTRTSDSGTILSSMSIIELPKNYDASLAEPARNQDSRRLAAMQALAQQQP